MVARPRNCFARRRFGRSTASVSTIAGRIERSRGDDSNPAYLATTWCGDGRTRYCRSLQGLKRSEAVRVWHSQKLRESASQTQMSMLRMAPELEMATAVELDQVKRRRFSPAHLRGDVFLRRKVDRVSRPECIPWRHRSDFHREAKRRRKRRHAIHATLRAAAF